MAVNAFTKVAFAACAVAAFMVARHYDKLGEEGVAPAKNSALAEQAQNAAGASAAKVSEKNDTPLNHAKGSAVSENPQDTLPSAKKSESASDNDVKISVAPEKKEENRQGEFPITAGCTDKLYIRGISLSKSPNPEDHEKARKNFKTAYESGCAEASVEYAKMLIAGKGGVKDLHTADKILKKASENNVPGAAALYDSLEQSRLEAYRAGKEKELAAAKSAAETGDMRAAGTACALLLFGEAGRLPGGRKNMKDAEAYCKMGAEGGDAESMKNLGHIYNLGLLGEKDPETAASWFLKASMKGSKQASLSLALMYYHGSGVEQNAAMAAELLEPFADQGDGEALYFLGKFYIGGGPGLETSEPKGMQLLLKSADSGYMPAMYFMASAFAKGAGVPKDPEKARNYYEKLAKNGHKDGMYDYANILYAEGNRNEADKWLKAAADKRQPRAMSKLAAKYMTGEDGFEKNEKKAVEMMKASVKTGDPLAMTYFGIWTGEGKGGIAKDPAKSLEWFEKAADAGNIYSMFRAGYAYRKGFGVEKDYAKAMSWLKKAADNGNAQAMTQLGIMHYEGEGTEPSADRAKEWLIKAESAGDAEATKLLKWMRERQAQGQGRKNDQSENSQNAEASVSSCPELAIRADNMRFGIGTPKDPEGARHIYGACHDAGYLQSSLVYAQMLSKGEGGEKDAMLARRILKEALDKKVPKAEGMLAEINYRESSKQEAFEYALKGYGKGDNRAQAVMCWLVARNEVREELLPKQLRSPRFVCTTAAFVGDPESMRILADMYERGIDGSKDPAIAERLRKDAEAAEEKNRR